MRLRQFVYGINATILIGMLAEIAPAIFVWNGIAT